MASCMFRLSFHISIVRRFKANWAIEVLTRFHTAGTLSTLSSSPYQSLFLPLSFSLCLLLYRYVSLYPSLWTANTFTSHNNFIWLSLYRHTYTQHIHSSFVHKKLFTRLSLDRVWQPMSCPRWVPYMAEAFPLFRSLREPYWAHCESIQSTWHSPDTLNTSCTPRSLQ